MTMSENKEQVNKFEVAVSNLEKSLLCNDEVKRTFETSWLRKFQAENIDVPQRYLIDFLHQVQITGANPVIKQAYMISYFDKRLGHKVGSTVYSYNFLLGRAVSTGEYTGVQVNTTVEDVFCPFKGETEKMLVSECKTIRNGVETKFKAYWKEFYNAISPQWKAKPYIMLEKCAIANCLRRAFPEALNGIYAEEEFKPEYEERKPVEIVADDITSDEREDVLSQIELKEIK